MLAIKNISASPLFTNWRPAFAFVRPYDDAWNKIQGTTEVPPSLSTVIVRGVSDSSLAST